MNNNAKTTEAAFIIRTGDLKMPYYLARTGKNADGHMVNTWTPFIEDAKRDFETITQAKDLAHEIFLSGSTEILQHGITVITRQVCPKCNKAYDGHAALSRVDNRTYICPACGEHEAAAAYSERVF